MVQVPLPRRVHEIQWLDGYFSKAVHYRRQPPDELERRIGYSAGTLREGYWLMFLTRMPGVGQFEVRGYSHLPDGKEVGGRLNAEERLRAEGYNLSGTSYQRKGIKHMLVEEVFRLVGADRLAKIRPVRRGDYPPGSGIPQWALTEPLPFVAAAFVGPGETYDGNYQ